MAYGICVLTRQVSSNQSYFERFFFLGLCGVFFLAYIEISLGLTDGLIRRFFFPPLPPPPSPFSFSPSSLSSRTYLMGTFLSQGLPRWHLW